MKSFFIQSVLIVLIIFTCIIISKCEHDQAHEIERLRKNEQNIGNLDQKCDSINHVTNVTLLTSKSRKETENLLTNQEKKAINKIGTTEKRLQEITTIHTVTRIDTILRTDTIIRHDTIIPRFYFNDEFVDFAGELDNGMVTFDLTMKDSINIVAHRVPRKFLFIKFGTKAVDLDVYNSNPYSVVKSAKRISIVK